MDLFSFGQLLTLMIVAFAISMDAFSISIGIGTIGISRKLIVKISIIFGLAHVLMPLIGILFAQMVSRYIGIFSSYIGGGVLCVLGVHMVYTGLFGARMDRSIPISSIAIMIFAVSVSIDALSIGFSLGLFSVNTWLTILLFGFIGMSMSCFGMVLGKHVGNLFGSYGEAIGGIVLVILGLKLIV